MSKKEQAIVAVRLLHPSVTQQEKRPLSDGDTLPPRSRLYGMVPCGEGRWSESLTSYLNRLGWRHGVAPRVLIAQEVAPYLNNDHLPPRWGVFYQQSAMNLNGSGSLALEWSTLLERLTGRSDLHLLTLLWWIGNLSSRGHLRTIPAWCPLCYRTWREQDSPIYQPQIWMFQIVTICPQHHRQLEDQCPCCHKPQCFIATHKSKPGQCTQCGVWLDTELDTQPTSVSGEELSWQGWVIHVLKEMHLASVSSHFPQWEIFFANLAACLKEQRGYAQFARLTGFGRTLLYRWPDGTGTPRPRTLSHPYIPSLETLLECCYACNITPLQVMTNELASFIDLLQAKTAERPVRPRRPASDRVDRERCLELMNAILEGREEPLSLYQVGKRLGHIDRTLHTHFPQECELIIERAQEHRKHRQEQRLEGVQEQVRQAVITLHAQGLFPSHRRLRTMLSPGVMRMPEANIVWRTVLRELGLKQ